MFIIASAATACDGNDSAGPSASTPPGASGAELLATLDPVRLYAADAGDQAAALASGDFNGDEEADVALAAAFGDGPENNRPDAGEVHIFLGPLGPGDSRDAAAGEQAATVYGAGPGFQAGRSLTSGDFNLDGIDDIAIGSPFGDGPSGAADTGRVDIVLGSQELVPGAARVIDLASNPGPVIYGASPGGLAGISLASAQLNLDVAADLVIGAFWASGPGDARPMAGQVHALFSAASLPAVRDLAVQHADVAIYGAAAGDRLGEGVAAGDVNGDGLDDLILPAPFAVNPGGSLDAGRTYIITSPSPQTIDLSSFAPLATIHGVDDGDQLGHVPLVADVDGDGKGDVILTAVSADGPDNTIHLAGEAAVFLAQGLAGELHGTPESASSVIRGESAEDRLGRSAGSADLDGDGSDELLLGAPGSSSSGASAGRLYVLHDDALASEVALPLGAQVVDGERPGDALASSVFGRMPIGGADMDGDGREEILVSAPGSDGPAGERRDCGGALVLFVKDTPAD